ncbi:maintenance of mitochondrial morphology protein 1 [Dendryphion nanum]|uniref:Maintenance of mitochondrial morphology protein 1 n=1 Tax=Dendryphion nanum TaxID=256645 RepID=A0A9P9IHR2_9PLEO|nr:maintenance of mitochondrial morphology protein 1 [Dendryphion nanum]
MGEPPPVPSSTTAPQSTQYSSLSFTQGFLLGQLSIALIIFFFIKFFIFGEPPSADDRALHLSSLRRARTLAHQHTHKPRSNSTINPLRPKASTSIIRAAEGARGIPSISQILAKTYYNVNGHQPESLDWFNVLIAQTIAQIRDDARQDGAILTSLTEVLNTGSKPDWIGEIKVTEIALGDEFPIFSNCRVMPAEDGFGISDGPDEGRLQARMDVDLSDVITLGIETTLVLNYPKPRIAVLPVALAVSVVRFSGTLAMSFIPSSSPPSTTTNSPSPTPAPEPSHPSSNLRPPLSRGPSTLHPTPHRPSSSSSTNPNAIPPARPTTLAFTFLDDYRLDLSVRSLVGSRSRLQDVPKIAQLIESRVHAWFDERAVEPRFQQIVLPSLWPRKRNTRGGGGAANGDEEAILDDEGDEGIDVQGPEDSLFPNPGSEAGYGGRNGGSSRPASFVASTGTLATSLEARIEAEGAKLRAAERKAGERSRSREQVDGGVRWRGEQRLHAQHLKQQNSRSGRAGAGAGGEWSGSGQRGMPGAMPGG